MSIRPAHSAPGAVNWGSFALVTYLPDPLGSFLTELRQLLPGDSCPEAHITFLPPRPMVLTMQRASDEIERILMSIKPFELELGEVKVFADTNMLYLSVEGGREHLLSLHEALNSGKLSAEEPFEFIPHLTLAGPIAPDEVGATAAKAETAWLRAGLSRRFIVNEVVLLWLDDSNSRGEWSRVSSYSLNLRD